MKKMISAILLAGVFLFLSCQTYQAGGTLESRGTGDAMGVVFAVDGGEYTESSLVFLPDMYPNESVISGQSFGYDFNVKPPFHFFNNHLSIFPMIGLESRYIRIIDDERYLSDDYSSKIEPFGFGLKLGGGFDLSPVPAFFVRGKIQYQPDITSFGNSYSGWRLSLALGYRTDDDPVRYKMGKNKAKPSEESKPVPTPTPAPTPASASARSVDSDPSRIELPGWIRMGMTLEQVRSNVPGRNLRAMKDVKGFEHRADEYFYGDADKEEVYYLKITPEKGLSSFSTGIRGYNVKSAALTITQRYGKPDFEDSEQVFWILPDGNPRNIAVIRINIDSSNKNFVNLQYVFSNFD